MSFFQKMSPKQLFGAALAVVGTILIVYAKHSMAKVEEVKNFLDRLTNFFSHNPSALSQKSLQ